MIKVFLLLLSGITAGFINGLLGTGGGIILIFALEMLLGKNTSKEVFTLSLSVTLFLSVLSCFLYYKSGNLDIKAATAYIIPALIGGSAGAVLAKKLKPDFMKKIFGIVCIIGGMNMAGMF